MGFFSHICIASGHVTRFYQHHIKTYWVYFFFLVRCRSDSNSIHASNWVTGPVSDLYKISISGSIDIPNFSYRQINKAPDRIMLCLALVKSGHLFQCRIRILPTEKNIKSNKVGIKLNLVCTSSQMPHFSHIGYTVNSRNNRVWRQKMF